MECSEQWTKKQQEDGIHSNSSVIIRNIYSYLLKFSNRLDIC